MRASPEQIKAIVERLGLIEVRRREIDLFDLSRTAAADLCRDLEHQLGGDRRRRTGGKDRARKPIAELPEDRQRFIRRLQADPDDPQHGTRYGYYTGRCRCEKCNNAT